MKVMYSLIGIFFVVGLIYNVYMDKKEIPISLPNPTEEPATQTEINYANLKFGVDLTSIYEGKEALDWLTNFLSDGVDDDRVYQKLVAEDIRYLNASNSTFAIRKMFCTGICANGGWDNESKEIMLFNESNVQSLSISDWSDEEVTFVYLHETGHLILDIYANDYEREKWRRIYNETPAEEFREYARENYKEGFADSYAFYRLGVLHSETRLEFIKKIEKKAGVKQ